MNPVPSATISVSASANASTRQSSTGHDSHVREHPKRAQQRRFPIARAPSRVSRRSTARQPPSTSSCCASRARDAPSARANDHLVIARGGSGEEKVPHVDHCEQQNDENDASRTARPFALSIEKLSFDPTRVKESRGATVARTPACPTEAGHAGAGRVDRTQLVTAAAIGLAIVESRQNCSRRCAFRALRNPAFVAAG